MSAETANAVMTTVGVNTGLDRRTFRKLCDVVAAHAGIHLKTGKEALVSARVAKRLRALGLPNAKSYVQYLESDSTGTELVHLLDAITTNYTFFYREPDHFDVLEEAIKTRIAAGQTRVRLWCAAAATGEEAYAIAMTALEAIGDREIDFKLLATDLSIRALEKASSGIYSETRLAPLGKGRRARWFEPIITESPERCFRANERLRSHIVFKRINLAEPPFPMRGPLDAIFCRNVMIYFSNDVRQRLVKSFESLIAPEGFVFTGHAESLTTLQTRFRSVRPAVYRLGSTQSK